MIKAPESLTPFTYKLCKIRLKVVDLSYDLVYTVYSVSIYYVLIQPSNKGKCTFYAWNKCLRLLSEKGQKTKEGRKTKNFPIRV